MSEATQNSHPVEKVRTTREIICTLGIYLGSVGLVVTLTAAALHLASPSGNTLAFLRVAAACWAIIPPLWFMLEWHVYNWTTKDDFDQLKYSHDCARAIWAGVGAVAAAVLLGTSSHL
jgi:hypothetical protein